MLIKKITISMMLILSLVTSAFAGSEDWNGEFTFQNSQNQTYVVKHAPTYVHFLFFTSAICIQLSKGANLNGMVIPENVSLCTDLNVEAFTNEVQKLGFITNKTVKLGPTYTN